MTEWGSEEDLLGQSSARNRRYIIDAQSIETGMARDEEVRETNGEESLLDRRSYLQLAGAATATVAGFSHTSTATETDSVLLDENFETEGYAGSFTSSYRQGTNDARVSDPSKLGSKSLQVQIPEGEHYGMAAMFDPVEAGAVDTELTEMYAGYWVRFSSDFDGGKYASKLPGPVNVEPGGAKGGEPATGQNGWSARGGFSDAGSDGIDLGYYVYHMDASGDYGDFWTAETVPRGKWLKVHQYIKLNTVSGGSANRDGQLKMWIDDELRIDKSGLRFTDDLSLGCNYWFDIYYGGPDTPPTNDHAICFDNWALNETELPDISGNSTEEPQGTVLELICGSEMPTTEYQFTVAGTVSKRTSAGDVSSEENDSVTDNGDGTMTVTGATGNGYGDSYVVDGEFTSFSDIDDSKWTIRYDGTEVTTDELVTGPTIDSFQISKSQKLGDDRMFSVNWDVSDDDANLDVVETSVAEGATSMNFSVTDISGKSASDWDLFQFPIGSALDVTLRVKDADGNVTKETKSITL